MKKLLLLSGLIYLFLYMLFVVPLIMYDRNLFDFLIFAVAKFLFGISSLNSSYGGSGDSLYDYVKLATFLLLSVALAATMLIILKSRLKLEPISNTILLLVRYYVGLFLISYGVSKLCAGQFSELSYSRLEQTYGNSSPMGLLWAFMGASKPYVAFIGLSQLLAGYLILFKRTKTFGALLAAIILLNVVILNFCYDVPVKLFSMHLLLMSVILITPDLRILYSFFIQRKAVQLPAIQPAIKHKKLKNIAKAIVITGFTLFSILHFLEYAFDSGDYAPCDNIDGMYSTDIFTFENDTLEPVATEPNRWKNLIIERNFSKLTRMTDSVERFSISVDSIEKTIAFTPKDQNSIKYTLHYSDNGGKLSLTGLWKGKKIAASFNKKMYGEYPLMNRGFHWVNETAYFK